MLNTAGWMRESRGPATD